MSLDVWDSFVVYAIEEGGEYSVYRADRDEFDRALSEGTISVWGGQPGEPPTYVAANYIAYLKVEDDFDFTLGRRRETHVRDLAA